MDDPVAGCPLPDAFLHQRLLATEELHSQFVVRGLKQRLQLIFDETLLFAGTQRVGSWFFLGGAIQTDVITPEMHLTALFVVHVRQRVREVVVCNEEGLVINGSHQRVSARVRVLDADLDGIILGEARLWRR